MDLFNTLNRAMFHGRALSPDQQQRIFDELIAYARQHFEDEERLMADAGADVRHRELHARVHHEFVEQVRSMWDARGHLRQPGDTLMGFLTSWLGLHIMGVDQSMARQMARIRAGADPAEAWAQEEDPLDRRVANLLRMVGQLYHVLAAQNQDLLEANARLEQRVRERTAELEGRPTGGWRRFRVSTGCSALPTAAISTNACARRSRATRGRRGRWRS